ncbi:MAG: flagellar basal-body rod protein FlgG [bacterium]
MIRSLWTAASGMEAQTLNVDVIANNLSNVNTTGFKRSRVDFEDLLYRSLKQPGTPSSANTEIPTGIEIGHGVRPVAIQKLFSQGDYQQTQNDLDLAIEGDGFFQVTQANGEPAYTRSGALKLDGEGRIVTSNGAILQPEITVPEDATSIIIGIDGIVSVLLAGTTEPAEIGTIELAKFPNPGGLHNLGKNLFQDTVASGVATTGIPGENGLGTIAQGYLEMSNVTVVEEMVNMIIAQRAYEANSKSVQTSDDLLRMANSLKR